MKLDCTICDFCGREKEGINGQFVIGWVRVIEKKSATWRTSYDICPKCWNKIKKLKKK
jgi:hypothetical protein